MAILDGSVQQGTKHIDDQYKLRSAGLNNIDSGRFIVQTFGVDKFIITSWTATTTLPSSDDFAGYKAFPDSDTANTGGNPPYSSASFQRQPYLKNGVPIFSGHTVSTPEFQESHGLED
jgi:hypothetical protein